jgi:hypothetical protein
MKIHIGGTPAMTRHIEVVGVDYTLRTPPPKISPEHLTLPVG